MDKNKIQDEMHDDGSYVIKKSRRRNILALIVCFLIAFCIWAVAESVDDGEQGNDHGAKQASVLCDDTAHTL